MLSNPLRFLLSGRLLTGLMLTVLLAPAAPVFAQDKEVPFWAAVRAQKINMRVGPAETYRISWVYTRRELPVKVIRVMEGWWLVEDPSGERGWMLGRLLTRKRGAIVAGNGLADMREQPDAASRLLWRIEPGVVGKLGDCDDGWCEFDATGHRGFISQARLWGSGEP